MSQAITAKTTFNFKSIKEAAFADLLAGYDEEGQAALREQFEFTEGAERPYKRKAVTVDIEYPAFISTFSDNAGDQLAKRALSKIVDDFVKSQYVDEFQEVGQHDWEFIASELAKGGRGSISLQVADELWQLAASTVKAWASATGLNAKLVAPFAAILAGKMTEGSIRKNFGKTDAETLKKIEAKMTSWAQYIVEHDADNADDLGVVYEAITKKMDKLLKRDGGEVLANLL